MNRAGLLIVGALLAAGCAGDGSEAPTAVRATETVPLGQLPDPPSRAASLVPSPAAPETTVPDEPEIEPITGPIGEAALGNRLLLIGDTVMATLTVRQDGTACPVLPDLGWEVQIEAEVARYLRFADEVIDEVVVDVGENWDAVGLMFGHQIDTGAEEFGRDLDRVLNRLGARPILVYTIAEFDEADTADAEAAETVLAQALNDEIRARGRSVPNVVVIDWAQAIADEDELDLVDDDRVPTPDGVARLVELTAEALGEAPATSGGRCLESVFTDDSAIVI